MNKETNVYCTACTGPNDCNWEGYEEEVIKLSESEIESLSEESCCGGKDDQLLDEYIGKCPKCGSLVLYEPSAR